MLNTSAGEAGPASQAIPRPLLTHFYHMIYKMVSSVHASPDVFNTSCGRSIEQNVILLSSDNESSNINDIKKSSSILQNQNSYESRHESRDETNDLADHLEYNLFN